MPWHAWESLGHPPNGPFKDAPAVSSWGPNRLDVFVRGADDQLWHKYYNGRWSAWEGLDAGLSLGSAPTAASWGPNRIDVFALGQDNRIWHMYYDGAWQPFWEQLGGVTPTSRPSVASWGPGRLDLFVRGASVAANDNAFHTWYDGAWHPWENWGGALVNYPAAVALSPGRLGVVGLFPAGRYYNLEYKSSRFEPWRRFNGIGFSDFTATASGPDVSVFWTWLGNDDRIVSGIGWNPATGARFTGWPYLPLGPHLASAPAAVSWGRGRMDVFARGADGNLWHTYNDTLSYV